MKEHQEEEEHKYDRRLLQASQSKIQTGQLSMEELDEVLMPMTNVVVTEVCSPPGVTETCGELGLAPGGAL